MLDIGNACVAYGKTKAFRNFSLHLGQGEMVSIIGTSGCGKTSLLYAIMDLVPLAEGSIHVEGGPAACGLMFQQDRLLPWKTAVDNILLGLEKTSKDEAMTILGWMGLQAKAKSYPSQLSGGERQRVALARTLVRKPRVLLLDEPLASLDEQTRETLQDDIKSYALAHNITALLVTHSIQEAIFMGQRIVVMTNSGLSFEMRNDLHQAQDLRKQSDFFRMERALRSALGGST